MIKSCDGARCKSAAQDEWYGNNMRVHNPMFKNGGRRCTVCGKEVSGDKSAKTGK